MRVHENTYTGGRLQRIADLIRAKTHRIEAWGNSREGFELYLVDCDGIAGCSISDRFRRLSDLRNAAREQYGPFVTIPIGRKW